MDNQVSIRLEVGVSPQQFTQMVQVHNQKMEELVNKGIESALNEIFADEETFINSVKNTTLEALRKLIHNSMDSWELKNKITEAVNSKMLTKLNEYTEKIADSLFATSEIVIPKKKSPESES